MFLPICNDQLDRPLTEEVHCIVCGVILYVSGLFSLYYLTGFLVFKRSAFLLILDIRLGRDGVLRKTPSPQFTLIFLHIGQAASNYHAKTILLYYVLQNTLICIL